MFYCFWSVWINTAAMYFEWMCWCCFDNILTNNPYTMFIQGFRGCHCADIHPEHVHSLCRPDALWMCNLCEDITRVGGGTDTQFAHQILTFKILETDASLSSWEPNSTPNEIVLTFCIWPHFTEILLFTINSLALYLNLHWKMKPIMKKIHVIILYTIIILVRIQNIMNSRAYVCWFTWPK